jgi:hypothetical protein
LFGIVAVLKERRLYPRQAINRVAKFQSGVGSLPRDCFITDVSERGARLYADGVEIPDQFVLSMTGEAAIRKECRVVWRLGGELGVEFVDSRARSGPAG